MGGSRLGPASTPFRNNLTLTVGAPFAYFWSQLAGSGEEPGFGLWGRLVVAMIDGTVCTVVPGGPFGGALIGVPSEKQIPGCGRAGKVVTFAIDGFAVPEVVLWQAGERPDVSFTLEASRDMTLAGPAFAYFEIDPASNHETVYLDAYVDGVSCGGVIGEPHTVLLVPVAPDALVEGCGSQGAVVTFTVNGEPFGVPVPWEPGFHDGPGLRPSGNQVTPPNAGSAGLKR